MQQTMPHNTKVLFILKRRQDYNGDKHSHANLSTGLYNSAAFMNDMLNEQGIRSKIAVVRDNNDIDRQVTKFKPKYVIIEALWVVPSKFSVLCKLHPNVKWIIRLHSEIPFLANEGIAMDWLGDYPASHNLIIAANAPRALKDLRFYLKTKYHWNDEKLEKKVIYLPNYYPDTYKRKEFDDTKCHIDIGCFGAIRPMKNHLTQAIAAIKFAESIGKKLRFHINAGRIEQKGDSVLNNLKALFTQLKSSGHQLIDHGWMPREEFLKVCGKMDIGMQVSMSETFNIVGADLMGQGVPLVGSNEIPWMCKFFTAKPTDTESIYRKLRLTHCFSKVNVFLNQLFLRKYTNKTRKIWVKYFED
jgi:hypothetical protein